MTQRYPLQWPVGRPRVPAHLRTRGKFSSDGRALSVAQALRRVDAELQRIQARNELISSNVEVRLDGLPRSGQPEPRDPGVCLYFDLGGKPHALACDTYSSVAQNLGALAAHLEATRAITRHGVATAAEMFTAFVALPPPRTWWQTLGLVSERVTMAEVESAYRALAAKNHPDKGGSDAAMAVLNRARDDARKTLQPSA